MLHAGEPTVSLSVSLPCTVLQLTNKMFSSANAGVAIGLLYVRKYMCTVCGLILLPPAHSDPYTCMPALVLSSLVGVSVKLFRSSIVNVETFWIHETAAEYSIVDNDVITTSITSMFSDYKQLTQLILISIDHHVVKNVTPYCFRSRDYIQRCAVDCESEVWSAFAVLLRYSPRPLLLIAAKESRKGTSITSVSPHYRKKLKEMRNLAS